MEETKREVTEIGADIKATAKKLANPQLKNPITRGRYQAELETLKSEYLAAGGNEEEFTAMTKKNGKTEPAAPIAEPAPTPEVAEAPVAEVIVEVEEEVAPAPVAEAAPTPTPEAPKATEPAAKPRFGAVIADHPCTCKYCGKTGKAGDMTGKLYDFQNLPKRANGKIEEIQVVCHACAQEHDAELRKEYGDWFREHKHLPLVPFTLERDLEMKRAFDAAADFKRRWGIKADAERKCANCGRTHGQETVDYGREGKPFVKVIRVERNLGSVTMEQLKARCICTDCEQKAVKLAKAQGKEFRTFDYAETLRRIKGTAKLGDLVDLGSRNGKK